MTFFYNEAAGKWEYGPEVGNGLVVTYTGQHSVEFLSEDTGIPVEVLEKALASESKAKHAEIEAATAAGAEAAAEADAVEADAEPEHPTKRRGRKRKHAEE